MTPERLYRVAILPAMAELSALGIPSTPYAWRFLLAIALQESNLMHRRQLTAGGEELGPASSFWQFEVGGGCRGVLAHAATGVLMTKMCDAYNVKADPLALWEAMRYNDVVAAMAARLLVYTLPGKLPATAEDGWSQYLAAWRPGKPHPDRWQNCWDVATKTVGVV